MLDLQPRERVDQDRGRTGPDEQETKISQTTKTEGLSL